MEQRIQNTFVNENNFILAGFYHNTKFQTFVTKSLNWSIFVFRPRRIINNK